MKSRKKKAGMDEEQVFEIKWDCCSKSHGITDWILLSKHCRGGGLASYRRSIEIVGSNHARCGAFSFSHNFLSSRKSVL